MYLVIVTCFLLSASCSPVDDNISSKIKIASKYSVISNQTGKNVHGTTHFVKSEHPIQIASRQRRSVWATVIDQIVEAAEKLHVKPVFVEGVNDVNNFNTNFKKTIDGSYDKVSRIIDEDEEESEAESEESDSAEEEFLTDEELKLNAEQQKIYDTFYSLYFKNDKIFASERAIMIRVCGDWVNFDIPSKVYLYNNLICDDKSLDIIRKRFPKNPKYKKIFMNGIVEIRRMREDFMKDAKAMKKLIEGRELGDVLAKEKEELKLDEAIEKNRKWLAYKMPEEFIRK